MKLYHALLIVGALALSGCEAATFASAGMFVYEEAKPAPPPPQAVAEVFCYKTIAAAECYDSPQEKQGYRFTGPDYYPQDTPPVEEKHWTEKTASEHLRTIF